MTNHEPSAEVDRSPNCLCPNDVVLGLRPEGLALDQSILMCLARPYRLESLPNRVQMIGKIRKA